ncbi:GntR family transcriptional regulator [Nitratireductor mangrovi]|uniref:GntR family transcriptional regulator n=1 Tax=Nitratireductor mangrovi TaxID=2599600 RepID=A0A5B8KTK7_9HYPH|nr:GntR family transcriptional regulator [Nitratireductor mangrovi]QDY98937.1 GntR family transcriptional regulator [Nitratireductor mangrovi]
MDGSATAAQQRITPVRRETFSSQIAAKLRRAIIGGEIEAGSQITETELAARFGVSRGPLREAMAMLASEGLIVTASYRGTRVLKLSTKDVREIYSLRTALETLAFREIWDRRDKAFADELAARHKTLMSTLGLNDHVASSEAEVRFHALVYEACGHDLLLESWQRIASRMQLYLAVHQRAHGRTAPVRDAHESYLRLALGDSLELMLEEVDAHMRRGLQSLEKYLDTYP